MSIQVTQWVHSGVTQATQAALEAETDQDTYAPPDRIKYSPGVAKQWCQKAQHGALNSPSYNTASLTDRGTGQATIVLATDFSTAVYSVVIGQPGDDSIEAGFNNFAVGSYDIDVYLSGGHNDQVACVAAFGDQ